jgi:hypothetical protein
VNLNTRYASVGDADLSLMLYVFLLEEMDKGVTVAVGCAELAERHGWSLPSFDRENLVRRIREKSVVLATEEARGTGEGKERPADDVFAESVWLLIAEILENQGKKRKGEG